MKIDTNFEKINIGDIKKAGETNFKGVKSAESVNTASSETVQNLSRKKALVDAIVITQIAESFFQKAVMISSKLKDIASEAQMKGKIENSELNASLGNINSSLNEIQDGITAPAGRMPENIILNTGVTVNVPRIGEEINALKNMTDGMLSGRSRPDLKSIDRIAESLTNKASLASEAIKQLGNALPGSRNISTGNIPGLTQQTVKNIMEFPADALKSQGNLSHTAVHSLV